jgi:PAS domain S-box-containing protein
VRAHAVPDSSGNIEVVGAVTDITQRKTAEDKIRRLIEAGILGIFIADVEDKIVEANQAFLQMLQYDRQDLVSGRLRWTDLTPAELRERDQRALTEALATGVFQPYEKEFLRKDGSRLPVLIGGALFQSANEGVVFVLDLSEQKRAEEGLRQGEQRFRLVLENIGAQVIATTLEGELEFVNQPVLDYFGKTKEQMNGWRTSDVIHPDDLASAIAVWKGSIESGASYDVDHRFRRSDGVYRWFHVVGRPQRDAQGSIVRWYTLLTDIDERKTAEEALRSSEADLLEAQRLSHMGSWRHDVLTGEVTFSPEVHRIFDIRPGEDASTARFFFSRIHPEDRPIEAQKYERANLAKTDFESDYRIVLPDGSIKYVHNLGHLVLNESGDSREFVGTVIDITERKTAEEKIREQETELRQLVDLVPQLIAVYGPNRERLDANRTALDYLGISLDEWRHKSFGASTHPDDSERLKSYTDRALSSGVPDELELRLRKHDGSYRWFLALLNPLRDEHGQVIRWYFTGTDIDDRKHAEDRLRQENVALKRAEEKIRGQEAELRQIMDLAPLLIGVYGPNRERLYANRTALNYHGMSLDEWRHASFADYSHPDDSERLKTFANRVFSSGTPGELELRTRKHDGSYRWFLARFYPLRDEQGQITRWYSTGTDIHDRKQSEDALRRENVALREEIDKASMFEEIVGTSPPLQTVLSLISKVAQSNSTVLITGETGTGKELVARAIHRRSNRASRPFVSVNCAAIPRDLIASELFGHEKGAFTGATQQRLGRFELANGGTLFLDEVGELPAESQIALLRVLQEHEFERVGGTRPIRADVRVIAATNRDLQAAIGTGSFRSDLFYRLNVFPIEIPALRERKEDIRLLLEYFIDRYARNAGKTITTVDKKTLQLLEAYPWPGNIRELQNVIERSVIVCETESFSVDESWLSHQPSERKVENQLYLSEKVAAQEKEMIEAALRECQGRVYGPSGAAAKLGIARSTLESKIRSLKINKNRFRA